MTDHSLMNLDIVDSTAVKPKCDCRFFSGNRAALEPIRIICSNFKDDPVDYVTTAGSFWRLAFEIKNPTTIPKDHLSIPVYVYSLDVQTDQKTNFDVFQDGFYLSKTAPALISGPLVKADYNLGLAW